MDRSTVRGGKSAIIALVATAALVAGGCGGTRGTSGASVAGVQASVAGTIAASPSAAGPQAGGEGAVVAGTFKSGRMQLTLTGTSSGPLDMPNLASAFGAPGSTGMGPGYKWYAEGDSGVAVTIRFPSDPVATGPTSSLPKGTGIQVEFDLIGSAGDLFSSSSGECTVSFDENTVNALRGRLDCHGVAASQDKAKTIDATGTFEAKP